MIHSLEADHKRMVYNVLTVEHQREILQQRLLELEAQHYGQEIEKELADVVDMPDVANEAIRRQAEFEKTVERVRELLDALS